MIVYPLVRLEAAGLETFVLDPAAGIFGQTLDLGDAITRSVAEDAPDADGTIDTTEFTGARNVTLNVILNPDAGLWALKRRLRAFTSAKLRPTMFVQEAADAPEQQITLRRSQFAHIIGDGPQPASAHDPGTATITLQWVAPLGILESSVEHTAVAYAAGEGATFGRSYPLTFSRVYPASVALGAVTLVNAGDADAYPIIRLYGLATEPVIDNVTQGRSIAFTGLTIAAGEFLEIDTRTKTIRMNGDIADTRYSSLNFPMTEWWTLSPGVNELRFHPATYIEGSTVAVVTWRDAYL